MKLPMEYTISLPTFKKKYRHIKHKGE